MPPTGGMRKTREQVIAMRRAGRVVAEMHDACRRAAKPGVTTRRLNALADEVLVRRNAQSNFRGYPGIAGPYPGVICASPNDVVVHGLPDDAPLVDGDLLSIDAGAVVGGWHADAAITVAVGDLDTASRHLLDATEEALLAGLSQAVAGNHVGDIAHAVQRVGEEADLGVVRDYAGHGIGLELHEDPEVPNHGDPGTLETLESGLCLAIEPMLTTGSPATRLLDDGWTVVTVDGGRAAHFEHSLAITDEGSEILTLP